MADAPESLKRKAERHIGNKDAGVFLLEVGADTHAVGFQCIERVGSAALIIGSKHVIEVKDRSAEAFDQLLSVGVIIDKIPQVPPVEFIDPVEDFKITLTVSKDSGFIKPELM